MYSLGGTALLRLPSDARLEVRNAGPGLSSLRCCCVALPFFSLDLVHLLFASYKMFPLVVSFFQNKQRSGHKNIKVILSEPEAQNVFYNLEKRFHEGKVSRKLERSPQKAGDESYESLSLEVIRSGKSIFSRLYVYSALSEYSFWFSKW